MARVIKFEGQKHSFPDDFTDEEIALALSGDGPKEQKKSYVEGLKDFGNMALEHMNPLNAPRNLEAIAAGLASGTRKVGAGIGGAVAKYNEAMGVVPPGTAKAFSQSVQSGLDETKGVFGVSPVTKALYSGAETVGQAAPMVATGAPVGALGRTAVGSMWGLLDYQPPDAQFSRAQKAAMFGAVSLAAPVVMEGALGLAKVGKGLAQKAYRNMVGAPDPWRPMSEAFAPLTRRLTGVNDALSGPPTPQTRSLAEYDDVNLQAQKLFGRETEAPLSAQMGSKRAASAEAGVMGSALYVDKASNEKTRMIENAFSLADDAATALRTGKVGEVRAGKMLASAQRNAETAARSLADRQYNIDIAPVKTALGKTKVIGNENQLKMLKEIVDENLGNIKDIEGNAARLAKRFMNDGNLDVDGFILRRSLFSRHSKKGGLLGIQNPELARQAAYKMSKAAEADFAAAVDRYVIDDGVKEAFQVATKTYGKNMSKLGDLENSVFGKLLGEDPTTFTEFATKAQKMTPEQYRVSMGALRKVSPNIDKRMGRFIMDEAKKASEVGSDAMSTEASNSATKYWKYLKKNDKFLASFPERSRKQVEVVLDNMHRLANKSSSAGGGGASTPQGAIEAPAAAAGSMSVPFIIKALIKFGYGPIMLDSLYTASGRKMLLNVTKGVLDDVNPQLYQRAFAELMEHQKKSQEKVQE